MRGFTLRFALAMALAVACAWFVTWGTEFVAAQPKAAPPIGMKVAGKTDKAAEKDLRPARDLDLAFGFPYERDAKRQLDAARQYLAFKVIPWDRVCPALQKILDGRSDSFFDIEYKVGEKLEVNRISVKTEANRIIAAFPKDGLEYYQQTYGQSAAALLDQAIKNNYDLPTLADLSQRYFHTRAGAEGTVLLGTIHLERGNYLEAAYAFERLLARPNSEEIFTPLTLYKAALAFRRSADPRHAGIVRSTTDRLERVIARDGLVMGGKTFAAAQVLAELDRPVEAIKVLATSGSWAGRYGNSQRNAIADAGPPFLIPVFRPREMLATGKNESGTWIEEELHRLFDKDNKSTKSLPLPAFFPVTTPDTVYFRTYDGVYAVATRDHSVLLGGQPKSYAAGDLEWISRTSYGTHQLLSTAREDPSGQLDAQAREEVIRWWGTYKSTGSAGVLIENPLIGTLAHDGQNVYFLDDLAIPPPPPNLNEMNAFGGIQQPQRQSGPLRTAICAGELAAVDMLTGNRVWSLGRVSLPEPNPVAIALPPSPTEEEADTATSAFFLCLHAVFLGPPLPVNGRLYVLVELDGVVRLLCLDPKSLVDVQVPGLAHKVPSLLWSQKLGKPTTPLPTDAIRRYQGAFLAAGEGIIVCPTNSGAVVGVDEMSHSLLWAFAYRKLESPPTSPAGPGMRFNPQFNQQQQQLPVDRWRAAAPIVSGGRVLITAYDSRTLDCLDIRTGKVLWSVGRKAGDLYVGGIIDDKVIVVGKSEVTAYRLTGEDPSTSAPKKLWNVSLPSATPTGHGAASKTAYYLPVRQANAGKDSVPAAQVWAINLESGEITSRTSARKRADGGGADLAEYGLGNLVFQNGLVVAQSPWEVAVYPQLEVMEAETNRRIAANPNDPVGLLFRGELLLDNGKVREAIADFKAAERNALPTEHLATLREKKYVAYTDLLQKDFAAGEPYLAEYAALCELPLDTDDELERSRRQEVTLRRKQIRLDLLARGREGQGRLREAFDYYLALAHLDEGKTPFEMPDDPDVRARSDVRARGQIERILRRATNPADRKILEDRVAAEWQAVREGNDLNRLQKFVDVFGPNVAAGAEAELALADALLRTHKEEAIRQAQVYLARLRATADDPMIRAKATEMLAGLLNNAGLVEDAVGLYLQLGKEFPNLTIRDGKTGADFLVDVLTDKRLLPYLDPTRFPLPARVKVNQEMGGTNHRPEFEVEPDGDLFPMFRRLRFAFDTTPANNNSWALRAYDRASGAERCRFPDMYPPMLNNPGGVQVARFVQGNGHLLLVQLGSWVYCCDLAEKKEKWRKNLFGDAAQNPNLAVESRDSGDEVVLTSTDGMKITMGKSAILQPGYVCLLTRDGLEVVEPTTRRPLWSRRNIADRTYVYGDARHILLVETNSDRVPLSTKLLRAVDGMPVEGAVDAGKILAAAKPYRIFGRTALLAEAPADQPRVLRLLDLATGKDIWRAEYDPKSHPIRAIGIDWIGMIKPTGEVELLSPQTGRPVATFKLDEKYVEAHLRDCTDAVLLADPDRVFLVLNRDGPVGGGAAGMVRFGGFNQSLRSLRVNGPMYCFERATGKRKWFVEDVLDHQLILLDRFSDLSVIVAGSVNGAMFKVTVIEKDRGLLRFNRGVPNDGNFFHGMNIDQRNGTVELYKYNNVRISIRADDEKPATK